MKNKQNKRTSKTPEIIAVPLESVVIKDNVRVKIRPQQLAELMTSMRQQGQFQPIGVSQLKNEKWELVWGHRRFAAAQKLGWSTIDAVDVATTDEKDIQLMNLAENVQRIDVSLPEQGRQYLALEKKGLTKGEIAARIGINTDHVRKAITAYQHIPKKYRDRIGSINDARQKKNNLISPTAALAVSAMVRKFNITGDEADKLYDWMDKDSDSMNKMKIVGQQIAAGRSIEDATKQATQVKVVKLFLTIPLTKIYSIQKKYNGESIENILRGYLSQSGEFGIL